MHMRVIVFICKSNFKITALSVLWLGPIKYPLGRRPPRQGVIKRCNDGDNRHRQQINHYTDFLSRCFSRVYPMSDRSYVLLVGWCSERPMASWVRTNRPSAASRMDSNFLPSCEKLARLRCCRSIFGSVSDQ